MLEQIFEVSVHPSKSVEQPPAQLHALENCMHKEEGNRSVNRPLETWVSKVSPLVSHHELLCHTWSGSTRERLLPSSCVCRGCLTTTSIHLGIVVVQRICD